MLSSEGLSKACIAKENELKTCPIELSLYIYKGVGNYWNVQVETLLMYEMV